MNHAFNGSIIHLLQVGVNSANKLEKLFCQCGRNEVSTSSKVEKPTISHDSKRNLHQATETKPINLPATSLTTYLADTVSNFSSRDLSDTVTHRSKRTILDIIGVGVIGSQTEVSQAYRDFASVSDGFNKKSKAAIWGVQHLKSSAPMAAYLNGASCHAMDFDDTWHPATHPSGPVLPAILALSDWLPESDKPSLHDVLVAYNIGIQVQGALLRCSQQARNIPHRLHPPSIVGVMGSAAASSRLLGLGSKKCRHAMAIAASFAGAPMANAGTTTKPLHSGKSARFGLEAALLASKDIEGNENILDIASGFGAFYDDYNPEKLLEEISQSDNMILHEQDIAIKRFPCHLGMHWGIDAAMRVREEMMNSVGKIVTEDIIEIKIIAPKSRYINRPIPTSEHEARHSFQFTVCSALLDGEVTPETFHYGYRRRQTLHSLLHKTEVITPDDNIASFENMYIEVAVCLKNGQIIQSRCNTPYGHWRYPLSDQDVQKKFTNNTKHLPAENRPEIIKLVQKMSKSKKSTELTELLQL